MAASPVRGFTLVEVLIAMAVTAFVAAIAYGSIATVMNSVSGLRATAERTQEVNRAWTIISRDFYEFVPRPVRDEFGEPEPALSGGDAARFQLSLTRAGWHNPNGHPRSNLQRVNYRLDEQGLWRDSYTVLDRAADTEPVSVLLLADVEQMELAFLGTLSQLQFESRSSNVDTANWSEDWVQDNSNPTLLLPPPQAVELTLYLSDMGQMRRLYALPPL